MLMPSLLSKGNPQDEVTILSASLKALDCVRQCMIYYIHVVSGNVRYYMICSRREDLFFRGVL